MTVTPETPETTALGATQLQFTGPALELFGAAEAAIAQIPPAFPLDATVAVNPWLGQAGEGRAMAAARMRAVGGRRVAADRARIAAAIEAGEIGPVDLGAAAASAGLSVEALRAAARLPVRDTPPLPMIADLARDSDGVDWPGFVADRIGLWAAARFDAGQALWPAPEGGVFATWKAFAARDLTAGLAGLGGFAAHVAALPDDPRGAFAACCARLGIGAGAAPLYFHRVLTELGGWAQLARGAGWLAERDGGRDDTAFALLTVGLAWEAGLRGAFGAWLDTPWRDALAAYAAPLAPGEDEIFDTALQEAADFAAERALTGRLAAPPRGDAAPAERPAVQAAFCIDVRSEVFRRALESADPEIATIGFAGFFGLAVRHRGAGSDTAEARAPVLLAAAVDSRARADHAEEAAARISARAVRAWNRFKVAAVSAFAFVEAAGPLYAGKLVRDMRARPVGWRAGPVPRADLDLPGRVAAAAGILRAMSLTEGFARLVLIAGHGAGVTNVPHASALQCGACGGHAGDVNARLLAGMLNEPAVRDGLRGEGIEIPADTRFIAGLHDTVSDVVTLFEDGKAPDHGADISRLREALERAAALARAERAAALPRGGDGGALALRGGDWSEIRPEWGLAGCAAFIAAPRSRTAGRDFGGRVFLHSYNWRADEGFGTLELILTAPVVVASWIALQYHGSCVAPQAFGAGNKLLHNVTGGIGVVEGNGGTLRPGLPWQSVHDGEALRHDPVRLAVVVEAPEEAISGILTRHDHVRDLFDNGWLSLHRLDAEGRIAGRYHADGWESLEGAPARSAAA